jgi:WD40-like Beta Propeller Repeat
VSRAQRWAVTVILGAGLGCGQLLGLGDPVDASLEGAPATMSYDAAPLEAAPREGGDAPDALPDATEGDADAGLDATDAPDAPGAACDPGMPFAAPVLVAGTDINLPTSNEGTPRLSPDELTLYFWSDRDLDGGTGDTHVYIATRSATTEPFGPPSLLADVNSSGNDDSPTVTADGMTLVFASDRTTGVNDVLFEATRGDGGDFGAPAFLPNVNTTFDQSTPYLRPDGQVLYFVSDRGGSTVGEDVYRAVLQAGVFSVPSPVTELNSTSDEYSPAVSPDDRVIYWGSDRPGGSGDYDIYMAQRSDPMDGFGPATDLGPTINSSALDLPGWISPDGCTLYLESERGGLRDLYVAQRP